MSGADRTPRFASDALEVFAQVGSGRRARVFEARHQGVRAVVKVYTESQEKRCAKYMNKSAARFEYERNAQFYANAKLRDYGARPLACVKTLDGDEAFVQEYIDAPSLSELLERTGALPAGVFEAGRAIVEEFERSGLFDMDTPAANVKVAGEGRDARPVFFDFNLLPQCIVPPNPLVALLYKLGRRKPTHRDYRGVASWLRGGLLTP